MIRIHLLSAAFFGAASAASFALTAGDRAEVDRPFGLIRIEDAQHLNLSRQFHPDFDRVGFPEGRTKVVG